MSWLWAMIPSMGTEQTRGRPPRRIESPELAGELRSLSTRIRRRQAGVQELEEERLPLIRQALAEGWTHAQIAEATGLSRARVGQIALGRS